MNFLLNGSRITVSRYDVLQYRIQGATYRDCFIISDRPSARMAFRAVQSGPEFRIVSRAKGGDKTVISYNGLLALA